MSGMAGNVTAFNTVWTYDIYQGYINKTATDEHYLWMGRVATVGGIVLSIGAAYLATAFKQHHGFAAARVQLRQRAAVRDFSAGHVLKRTTGHAAFTGLIGGTCAAVVHHGLTLPINDAPGIHGGWIAVVHQYPSEMAQNFWTAIWAFTANLVITIVVTMFTKPRDEKELVGLVYSLTPKPVEHTMRWWEKPSTLAIVVLALLVVLNLVFA